MTLRWLLLVLPSAVVCTAGCSSKTDAARKASMRTNLAATAAAFEKRPHPRPPRRDRPALPGTFGDAFTAHEAERKALEATSEVASQCARSAADGGKPTCGDLGPTRPALDALLDLGRAERAGAPASATPFAPMNAPPLFKSIIAVCNHTAARAQLALESGAAQEAGTLCVQTLEVARDFVAGANLVGGMSVAACVEKVEPPCGRALAALPADARERARQDLQAVAGSMPEFAELAEAELVGVHLPLCGNYLDAAERAQLGPLGRAAVLTADAQYDALPAGERSMHLTLCLDGFEAAHAAARAYREPAGSPARGALLAEHDRRMRTVTGVDIGRYADKYDAALAKLRGLAR